VAVALNGSGYSGAGTLTSTGNVTANNVVVPAGTNQMVVGWISDNSTSLDACTAVTWNGQSLTKKLSYQNGTSAQGFTGLWYLLNPTPATGNGVATFTNPTSGIQDVLFYTLQNVNQAAPFGNTYTKESSTGSVSQVVVGATGNLIIDGLWDTNNPTAQATVTGTGQALIVGVLASGDHQFASSQMPSAPSATIGWTSGTNFFGNYVVADVQQQAGGIAPILMGQACLERVHRWL
jgi:hypothetical protein